MRADPLRSNVDELFVFHVMGMLQIYLHDSTVYVPNNSYGFRANFTS